MRRAWPAYGLTIARLAFTMITSTTFLLAGLLQLLGHYMLDIVIHAQPAVTAAEMQPADDLGDAASSTGWMGLEADGLPA